MLFSYNHFHFTNYGNNLCSDDVPVSGNSNINNPLIITIYFQVSILDFIMTKGHLIMLKDIKNQLADTQRS